MELTTRDDVHVLTLDEGSQVLNDGTVAAWHRSLDAVEAAEGPTALVITGTGKAFHQGLDLPYVMGLGDGMGAFLQDVHEVFGRLLGLDVPTVAAINGHAQAGGAMLGLCCDLRIMRADRGWFRLPEVELGLPFTTVMNDLIAARVPQPALHRLMVLGQRMGGAEAAAAGVVDGAVDGEGAVLEEALARAVELARYRGPVLQRIRTTLYADLISTITTDRERADVFSR